MLFSLRVCVKELESSLHDEVNSLDLGVEYEFQSVLVDLLALSGLLSKHFVSSEERLDSRDSDWDEISPSDVTTLVFVGKGQEDPDIIIAEVVRRQ